MNLSELFTNNYEYLNTVAKRITRCKDQGMAPDLLSETYLNISEKQESGKLNIPQDNEGFVKLFSKYMKNYFVWRDSSFTKLHRPKESLTIDVNYKGYYHESKNSRYSGSEYSDSGSAIKSLSDLIIDEEALQDIELLVEDTNEATREILEISSSIGRIKALKYTEVLEFKRTLQAHDFILFELYFEKELSTRQIAELYSDSIHKMNYQSVNQMVNKIKLKIKTYKWKA